MLRLSFLSVRGMKIDVVASGDRRGLSSSLFLFRSIYLHIFLSIDLSIYPPTSLPINPPASIPNPPSLERGLSTPRSFPPCRQIARCPQIANPSPIPRSTIALVLPHRTEMAPPRPISNPRKVSALDCSSLQSGIFTRAGVGDSDAVCCGGVGVLFFLRGCMFNIFPIYSFPSLPLSHIPVFSAFSPSPPPTPPVINKKVPGRT